MKIYKLVYPYRKDLREVVTHDYGIFTKEKDMLEKANYKLEYKHYGVRGDDEYHTYVYMKL